MYGMSWSLVLALGVSTSLAMYAGTELTSYIFKKEVMKSESVWIDEVYVTWCWHCQIPKVIIINIIIIIIIDSDSNWHQSIWILSVHDQEGWDDKGLIDGGLAPAKKIVNEQLAWGGGGGSKSNAEPGGGKESKWKKKVLNIEKGRILMVKWCSGVSNYHQVFC